MNNEFFYFINPSNVEAIQTVDNRFVEVIEAILADASLDYDVWPLIVPTIHAETTDLYPAITYRRITGGRVSTNRGQHNHTKPIFQLTVVGKDATVNQTIAQVLSTKLDGYLDSTIWGCRMLNRVEMTEESIDGSDIWLNKIIMEFQLLAIEESINPRISFAGTSGDLLTGLHDYMTEQGVRHHSLNADYKELSGRMPYFVMNIISTESYANANNRIGSLGTLVQFAFFGDKYDEVKGLHETVRNYFAGLSGTLGSVSINSSNNLDEIDSYSEPIDGDNVGTFQISSIWNFLHTGT
jgi:hypothetical protein